MSIVVEANKISKVYRLGQFSGSSIGFDIKRWLAIKQGKQDPLLSQAQENDRTSSAGKDSIVSSLKDVSFSINKGDSLGIIGRNGAGKSTLLKILSQVTTPSSGSVTIKGKVASLLEVGTGFHPELSGRENIFLNGAILGMKVKEIKNKFDEIVDFSGVERYLDTPVKRYSSGMYVRLAFAVAAHLESDILIVDEVLAVGDAEFQRKCMGKMNDLGSSSGRTIIFVSHNMAAINQLCNKSLFLNKGMVVASGDTSSVIASYLNYNKVVENFEGDIPENSSLHGTGEARFTKLRIFNFNKEPKKRFGFGENIFIDIELTVYKKIEQVLVGIHIVNNLGEKICMLTINSNYTPIDFEKGAYNISFQFADILMPGEYAFGLSISHFSSGADIDYVENFSQFTINRDSNNKDLIYPWPTIHGIYKPNANSELKKIE